jgi:transcription initiation factor TFIIB
MSTLSRNATSGLNSINAVSESLELSASLQNKTLEIFRKVAAEGVSGRSVDRICVASILVAAEATGEPVSIEELCEFFSSDETLVYREKKRVKNSLDINVSTLDVNSYISDYAPSKRLELRAKELFEQSRKNNFQACGKSQRGLAAAAIYIASIVLDGEKLTQSNLAEIAGVTEVTIRNNYKSMAEHASV